ncbi:glycosyltransferase [Acidithiobacillus sp.]|jgi:glycosyltransferase involved in cell wall biosynthesis|uniref:glycosyltransferase n=1 Tax=Acidithiobacillus sp. TaxID=1872118 RepID=UPI0025BF0729|nr:glycosyltransferase [Acidithiobacillus sp.]MCK9187960.1 glycosyltransferase [Acidithiobacillus sp.]MCK9359919.1 glycosyltransferase [Acidithiobacillus sp.]
MKILHVLESFSPRYGGPVSVASALACAEADAGHEVTVCTTNVDYPSGILRAAGQGTICNDRVQLFCFPVQFRPLTVSWNFRKFIKIRLREFDVVHIHGLYRFPPTYAAYQARKQNVPYIIRPHGALDPYLYTKSSRSVWLKRLYERWFDLPNLHGAGAIHYTAEDERQRAAFLGLRAPSFVVPNGINWGRYAQLPTRGAFRSALGLGDAPLVLFLGRLHPKKGLDLLVPAFETIRRRIVGAQLAIVGPENDRFGQQVRAWVADRGLTEAVHFVGHLDGADVIQAYVDADVFVLPSYTENFGMTVVEAMACALPVVISDQVNIYAEVAQSGAGLVTRCEADEVAEAVIALLVDPERRGVIGRAGREAAQTRYTWPNIVDALSREYESVIRQNKTRYSDL